MKFLSILIRLYLGFILMLGIIIATILIMPFLILSFIEDSIRKSFIKSY
jgi:hypothetical protein